MRLTLIDMLRDRAAAQPDDVAYTYLEAGEQEAARLTWADVDRRSRALVRSAREPPGGYMGIANPPA